MVTWRQWGRDRGVVISVMVHCGVSWGEWRRRLMGDRGRGRGDKVPSWRGRVVRGERRQMAISRALAVVRWGLHRRAIATRERRRSGLVLLLLLSLRCLTLKIAPHLSYGTRRVGHVGSVRVL